jgi:CubicO group peptidase (beta-lactamase class C family)
MYSTGADVLCVLIARACGQPFETFLRERLFEPLAMTGTGFAVPAANLGRLAAGYWPGHRRPGPRSPGQLEPARPPSPSGARDPQAGLSAPSMITWPSPRCC